MAIQNGQVKQKEEEFLCPLPCAMVDRIRIRHSISLIYITHVAVSVNHHSWLLRKEYSVRPRSNAVKCRVISAAVWLWYFTDQSLYVHMSNSNEITTQWVLANESFQLQRKLWDSHNLTLQPVITYIYFFIYISNCHSRIGQKLNWNVTQALENI